MNTEIIQFVGVKKLPAEDQARVHALSTEYHFTIQRQLKNLTSLIIHVKEYKKEGKRHKYSIHVRAVAPTQIFESTKAADWDLSRTLHKAFKDLEREIQHQLHTDDQRPRIKSAKRR